MWRLIILSTCLMSISALPRPGYDLGLDLHGPPIYSSPLLAPAPIIKALPAPPIYHQVSYGPAPLLAHPPFYKALAPAPYYAQPPLIKELAPVYKTIGPATSYASVTLSHPAPIIKTYVAPQPILKSYISAPLSLDYGHGLLH